MYGLNARDLFQLHSSCRRAADDVGEGLQAVARRPVLAIDGQGNHGAHEGGIVLKDAQERRLCSLLGRGAVSGGGNNGLKYI